MVQYASNAPHPDPVSPLSNTQIGPALWLLVGRSGEIMVEFINDDGFISYRAPKDGELAAAKQLTWWASDANPLRTGRPVPRADGLTVRGWLTASLQGAYWIAVEVEDAKGRTLPGASIIPRWADAAAFVDALLTLPIAPSPSTIRNGSRLLA